MFSLAVFDILLFEGRSVLGSAQRVPRSESVKVSVENQKIGFCWNYLKCDWLTSLGGFEWFLILFLILFNLSVVSEKLKNLVYEMPIISLALNISNLRTKSKKSINQHTITKLIKCSLKTVHVKAMFTLIVFEILLFEGRSVLSPTQRGTSTFAGIFKN